MAYQIDSIKYLYSPDDSIICTFNDPADPDHVGFVTEMTGLGGAPIRQNIVERTEANGAVLGRQYRGARSFTWKGFVTAEGNMAAINARLDKIQTACEAMDSDARLIWFEDDDDDSLNARMSYVRLAEFIPSGMRPKEFYLAFTSANSEVFYPIIEHPDGDTEGVFTRPTDYGYRDGLIFDLEFPLSFGGVTTMTATLTNHGNTTAYPRFTFTHSVTNPKVVNEETGASLDLNLETAPGDILVIDMLARTVTLNGESIYNRDTVVFPESTFWGLLPGANTINFYCTDEIIGADPEWHFLSAYL